MPILERAAELDQLHALRRAAHGGHGSLVFVSGEMGIGKTTLVTLFIEQLPQDTVARIQFDGLSIPEPMGSLFDIARHLGYDAGGLMASRTPRASVFRAIETSLRTATGHTLIVAEDAHWADDASLEFIRFLGRRIGGLRATLIVTFRDDELGQGHPLRHVVGDLATDRAVHRIVLAPLSIEAVRTLAGNTAIDPEALHAYTGGNPFFVSEVVAAGTSTPISLRDAVLGRASRLDVEARHTLDAAAAIGTRVDPVILAPVVERLIDQDVTAAIDAGLLRSDGDSLVFRHAAVRAIIHDEISPARSLALHRRILGILRQHPSSQGYVAKLAFHAEQARDRAAAFGYAIEAAIQATRLQSHREAADQYARALRCADDLASERRADILEAHAYACFFTSRMPDAIVSQQSAATIWRDLDRPVRYGTNLRRLSRFWLFDGHYRLGGELAEECWKVLRAYPESADFAFACGYLAEWRIRSERLAEARDLSDLAMTIARRLNQPATTAYALITMGMVQLAYGEIDGHRTLEAGRTMAQEIGHEEFELRALTHLGEAYGSHRFRTGSRPYVQAGLDIARTKDLSTMTGLFGSVRLTLLLDSCDWTAAMNEAELLIQSAGTAGRLLLIAHLAWVRARLRSGQAEPDDLETARRHAETLDDPVALAMVTSVDLERAWLSGTPPDTPVDAIALLNDTQAAGDTRVASELALWMWRTSALPNDPPWVIDPYRSEIRGDMPEARAQWSIAGVPLEALRVQSAAADDSDLRAAHARFIALGAEPDAARIVRRMQALGHRGIPRGPRPSTRANPELLSRREIDVLNLLARGLTNREIAHGLSVSPKTVDHHVSAVLGKLGAGNRQQAVVRAREAGILPN